MAFGTPDVLRCTDVDVFGATAIKRWDSVVNMIFEAQHVTCIIWTYRILACELDHADCDDADRSITV